MTATKMKIKKGDTVVVISGSHKGKTGEVLRAVPSESRVVVAGVNVVKKHTKPTQFSAGGIEEKELPIHVSNVALADPKTGAPSRVGYQVGKDGKKSRVAKKSGQAL